MSERTFTLDEAHSLLPVLESLLRTAINITNPGCGYPAGDNPTVHIGGPSLTVTDNVGNPITVANSTWIRRRREVKNSGSALAARIANSGSFKSTCGTGAPVSRAR